MLKLQPVAVFVGYLMLDAWIGNTDRHHENWGYARAPNSTDRHLAPTFDHASSLGCHETDEKRSMRLNSKDKGRSVEAYVEKARSAFYAKVDDQKPLSLLGAFRMAAKRHPAAATFWLKRLETIHSRQTLELIERIPKQRISSAARTFAQRMLECNRAGLLALREKLL